MATLPLNCASCHFRVADKLCGRHAPGTTPEEFSIAFWPETDNDAWCGSGKEADASDPPVSCESCVAWDHPEGGIVPDYHQGLPEDWWKNAGYCRRFSPGPAGYEKDQTHWFVTHAMQTCGDGLPFPDEETE